MTRVEDPSADQVTRPIELPGPSPLDRYELLEAIGTGATATVWRARDAETGQDVAIKRFHGQLLGDGEGRRRFDDEASAATIVSHPLIVSVIDRVSTEDELWLVFPYVAGTTLAERLGDGPPLSPGKAGRISVEVADALAAVHGTGLVHRDVKPGNILLGADGHTRLLDFGISKSVTDDLAQSREATGAGLAIGTLPYMAPEQLAAHPPTPATDVYALGAVLYEMLSGRRPYAAASAVAMAEAQRIPPPPMADAPPALADLVSASLAYDPGARPDATQFARAVRGWLDGRAEPAAITVAVPAAAAVRSPASRWPTRALAVAAAVLVLVIAFVAAGSLPNVTVQPTAEEARLTLDEDDDRDGTVQSGAVAVPDNPDNPVDSESNGQSAGDDSRDNERGADNGRDKEKGNGKAKGHDKDKGAGRERKHK